MRALGSTLALLAVLTLPGPLLAQGEPRGPEFRVNTFTPFSQFRPSVAFDPAGNFLVVWDGTSGDGDSGGVFAQRYASTGAPLGGEFRVNTYNNNDQTYPAVAFTSTGDFIVVWDSNLQDGNASGIFAQRYASTGGAIGTEFRVNTYTLNFQSHPAIACASSGNCVVVWDSLQDGSVFGVYAQRFDSSGVPLGGEYRVNTYTTNDQTHPVVASDSAGNFVVVWGGHIQDGDSWGIFAQRYDGTGTPLGGEFRVNSYVTESQDEPSVASDSAGNFVVAWRSSSQDGDGYGIFGQRYASTGALLGGEFRVNTFTTGHQFVPGVGSDSAGNFLVAWSSDTEVDGFHDVFAQRYSMIVPVELQSVRVE